MISFTNPVIAHRGASAYAPENTMSAFRLAEQMGAACIECDVMLSSDGVPFIIHDTSLKRTTKTRGEVGLTTAEQLSSLEAGRWFRRKYKGEPIPTLKGLLDWLVPSGLSLNLEIKPYPGRHPETVQAVLAILLPHLNALENRLIISSFEYDVLEMCHQLMPELPIGYLMDSWEENCLMRARAVGAMAIHMNRKLATRPRVDMIKQAGFLVLCYTVNRVRTARKLIALGVDAVFSDYPDLLGS